MAENRTKSWAIEEFGGVQRRSADRLRQVSPTVLQNFDFTRSGGYRFAYAAGSSNVGDSVGLPVHDYDDYGMSLWSDTLILETDVAQDLSSTSVQSLPRYLIPGVGVATHAFPSTTDTYTLGGEIKTIGSLSPIDLPRTTLAATTAGGSSGDFGAMTVTVMAIVFAPTRAGLVAYQSFTETGISVSANQSVTVALSGALPTGYSMKAYLIDESEPEGTGFAGVAANNNVSRQVFSDGASAMSIVFTNYTDTGFGNTSDALMNPSTAMGGVTLHNRRLWSIASEASFVGPYYYGYDPTRHWTLSWYSGADSPMFTAAADTALNSLTEFGVVIDGVRNQWVRRTGSLKETPNGTYSQKLYFARQTIAAGTQLGVGATLKYTVTNGEFTGGDITWFAQVGGVTVNTGSAGGVVYNGGQVIYKIFSSDRVEFAVDLTAGTFDVTEKDSEGGTVNTWSESGSLSGTTGTGGDGLEVMYLAAESAHPPIWLRFDFLTVEIYTDDTLATLTEETPITSWDGSSTTFTGDVLTWTIEKPAYVSSEGGDHPVATLANPIGSVIYSDIGYPNYASSYDQYVTMPLLTSERLTAVASTPAGLLVFGDSEAFMIRGDPALVDSFAVQRFSGTVGCDRGTRPAVMGGAVAFIWNGRVYGVTLGMGDVDFGSGLVELGRDIFDPAQPFIQVTSDPKRRHFVAIDAGNNIFRYSVDDQAWFTDPFTTTSEITLTLLPHGQRGLRYHRGNLSSFFELVDYVDTADTVGGEPYSTIKFEDVDVGDPTILKLWRRIRMYTNEGHSRKMALYYTINGSSGSVFGIRKQTGEYVFTFPAGLVSREIESLEFRLNGSLDDVIEPPLVIEYVPRYRRR